MQTSVVFGHVPPQVPSDWIPHAGGGGGSQRHGLLRVPENTHTSVGVGQTPLHWPFAGSSPQLGTWSGRQAQRSLGVV